MLDHWEEESQFLESIFLYIHEIRFFETRSQRLPSQCIHFKPGSFSQNNELTAIAHHAYLSFYRYCYDPIFLVNEVLLIEFHFIVLFLLPRQAAQLVGVSLPAGSGSCAIARRDDVEM